MSKGFSWIRTGYQRKSNLFRGDTIVEVMISMVVLAVVSGTAYSLSIRAFNQSADSQYRDQAVSYSQQQVELIKEADNNQPQYISWYQPPPSGSGPASDTAFCISPGSKQVMTGDSCVFEGKFTIGVTYQASTKVYKVTTSWPSPTTAGENNQTVVYYKASDSFTGSLRGCSSDTDPLCDPIQANVPGVGVSSSPATPPAIVYGTAVTINWNYTDVQAGSCVPASSPANSAFNAVNPNSVSSFSSSTLPAGDDTFKITCKDNAGNPVVGQTTVTVAQPAVTSFTANGVSGPGPVTVAYNTPVSVHWTSTSVTSCTASGPWSTGGQTSGTVSSSNITSNTTIGITCTASVGGPVTAQSININVITLPPPVISAFNTWSEPNIFTNQGAPRWLYWNSNANSCYLSSYGWVNPNSYVYINVYPGTYTLTCYNTTGQSSSANFAFNYYHSYFIAYQNARFDKYWPGWQWGPVGEGYYGIPGDTSALSAYGRVAVRDNSGHCATFQNVNYWQLYGWVEDYGLRNDNFGSADVGHDCGGN